MISEAGKVSRRRFLSRGARALGCVGVGVLGGATILPVACALDLDASRPLAASDSNGLRLRRGFRSRIVARSGQLVESTSYVWHQAPDGGAVFAASDGGWIYVSNSEVGLEAGGVSALRFASDGSIVDAYSILTGTSNNCAGGATPWKTWLSCEEIREGEVYECDPFARDSRGDKRPALGVFRHEAVAVDSAGRRLYLTEDEVDGLFYRFTPSRYPSLASGTLEAMEILDPEASGPIVPGQSRPVVWHRIVDPGASNRPTRFQGTGPTAFNGGEGCVYGAGLIHFSTKGDDRVWKLDPFSNRIEILYDRALHEVARSESASLSGVDNLFAAPNGDVYVAEDPGQQQIVVLTASGDVEPLVQVVGHPGSEVTGPALSPDGTRLYFSSQRSPGTTFEVTGPF